MGKRTEGHYDTVTCVQTSAHQTPHLFQNKDVCYGHMAMLFQHFSIATLYINSLKNV